MKLKVLHITYTTSGGAGIAVVRLHNALLSQGIESKILVGQTDIVSDNIVKVAASNSGRYVVPKIPLVDKIIRAFRRKGMLMTKMEKLEYELTKLDRQHPAYFDLPISSYRLERHPLVEWADIVHIHWISGFVDFPSFFVYVHKPIVWTMHDLNPFYGGFHHIRLREKYYSQYAKLEEFSFNIKKSAITKTDNLTLIALSSEMKRLMQKYEIYKYKPIYTIHNCVDPSLFRLLDKSMVRKMLDWTEDRKVLLFVNANMNDSEKGLVELMESVSSMEADNILLVCVGDGVVPKVGKQVNWLHYNSVKDVVWLNMLYSAADFLVQPSHQEAFPLTPIEAMCCGTPVIITPVSGAEDIINDDNGIIAQGYTPEDISLAITTVINHFFDSEKIRTGIIEKYAPNIIAGQYIDVYKKVLA